MMTKKMDVRAILRQIYDKNFGKKEKNKIDDWSHEPQTVN